MNDKDQGDETGIEELLGYANSIIGTLREPFLVLNKNLRVISTNQAFYTSFKVTEKETIDRLLPDLGDRQWNIPKLIRLLKEIIPEKKVVKDYEVEHKFEQIGPRVMLLNACQLRVSKKIARIIAKVVREEEEGEEELILLAINDITERKEIENGMEKARKELEATKISEDEAREYAESIINTVREPLIALDQDLRVINVSHSFYEFFKVKPEETVGQLIYDLGNKQWDIPKLRELLETILPQKTTFDDYEVEHVFVDIGRRVMLLNARQIQRVFGKERIILLAIEDITDRKRLEKELLRTQEENFKNVFDNAGDGILLVEIETQKFFMGNKAICRMLGYSQNEINDFGIMDIHPEKDLPFAIDQYERQAKGEFSVSRDMPIKRKDGNVFYADINATTVTFAGKTYLMGIFHDVSERKEVEDLKRIDQLKKDFISNMSHELRTPLNAVIGFSEVLVDQKYGVLNETQKDYLNDILESGKFLLSLINDILDLAKIESGKTELVVSDFSLKELLEHSLIFVKEKAIMHNIELSLEITEDVGYIRADERKARQIVFNLLSNAVKFTPNGGKVGLKAKINGSFAEVTVWDTGIGISKEDQNKLFRPFMQLETSLAKKHEGTGLGLSLAKELTLLHKGKIWVESEGKDNGSSFKFSLPIGEL